MKHQILLCLSVALAAFVVAMIASPITASSQYSSPHAKLGASNNDDSSESQIQRGFEIAASSPQPAG